MKDMLIWFGGCAIVGFLVGGWIGAIVGVVIGFLIGAAMAH